MLFNLHKAAFNIFVNQMERPGTHIFKTVVRMVYKKSLNGLMWFLKVLKVVKKTGIKMELYPFLIKENLSENKKLKAKKLFRQSSTKDLAFHHIQLLIMLNSILLMIMEWFTFQITARMEDVEFMWLYMDVQWE